MKKYPSIKNGLTPSIVQRVEQLKNKELIEGSTKTVRLLNVDLEMLQKSKDAILQLMRHQEKVTEDIRSNDIAEQNYDYLTGNYGDLLIIIETRITEVQENIFNLMGYYKQ